MPAKVFRNATQMLIGVTLCLTMLWIWIESVQAFPDRDSIHQLLFPILNYLKASTVIGNDLNHMQSLIQSEYPWGILAIPWIISAVGLQETFLEFPWLLSLFLILPLCLTVWLIPQFESKRFLVLAIIFFFPPIQLLLKNLNLHSFVIMYALAGIFLMLDFNRTGRKFSLIAGILFFIFSCSIKHLGLILFANLWVTQLLWLKRNNGNLKSSFVLGISIGLLSLYFYPEAAFLPYLDLLRNYNPLINPTILWVMSGSAIFIILFAWFQSVEEEFGRGPIEKFFYSPIFLLVVSIPILGILSMKPDFHGLSWMIVSFVVGNALLIAFLRWKKFESEQGLLLLIFLMLIVTALVFYFSRLGQVSAFFILPITILLILILQTAKSDLTLTILGCSFLLLSNFFPQLQTLESLTGSRGFHFFARGYNMLHQNPLGWSKSEIINQRNSMTEILQKIEFPESQSPFMLGRYGIHHHYAVMLHYPKQFLFNIPHIALPEDLPIDQLEQLRKRYKDDPQVFYKELLEKAEIPLIIEGNNYFSKYEETNSPSTKPQLSMIREKNLLRASMVKKWLHDSYFEFLRDQDLLATFYRTVSLGSSDNQIKLHIHKKLNLLTASETHSPALAQFIEIYQRNENPDIKIIEDLNLRAQRYNQNQRFLEAVILLEKLVQIAPDNQVFIEKLNQSKAKLRSWEKEVLEKFNWQKLFKVLVDSEALPWTKEEHWTLGSKANSIDLVMIKRQNEAQELFKRSAKLFETDQNKARELLKKVLEIDPNHTEALKDLEIIRQSKPPVEENPEVRKHNAEKLFLQTIEFFESDPAKAVEMLTQVLELDPQHAAAKEDLALAKSRLESGWRGKITPERKKAEVLFKKSTQFFESNPSMAIQILTQVITLDPGHSAAKEDLALAQARLKQLSGTTKLLNMQQAKDLLSQSNAITETNPVEALALLKEATALKLFDQKLIDQLENAEERIYQQAETLFLEASQFLESNPENAVKLLNEVIGIIPNHTEATNDLKIARKSISRKEAEVLYHESLKHQGSHPRKALEILQKVLKLDPDHKIAEKDKQRIEVFLKSDSVLKARGRWFFSQAKSMLITNPIEASQLLKKALKMDPGNLEAHKLSEQLFSTDTH